MRQSDRTPRQKEKKMEEKKMIKRTKTWKIGEYCDGGIICVKSVGDAVLIEIRDYLTNELINRTVFGKIHTYRVDEYLSQFTTPYYSDKVTEWIKQKVWGLA